MIFQRVFPDFIVFIDALSLGLECAFNGVVVSFH